MCSFSTNRKSVKATGRIWDILFVHMALIIDSSLEVFIECVHCCVVFPMCLTSSVKKQGPKDEIERLGLWHSSNKSKTLLSLSVASTLYTRGYFAVPDHCGSVFFVRWMLVRRSTVNGTVPASSLTLM